MDYYGVDPEEMRIKQLLTQAAALRNQSAPRGQTVGSGGFEHYVAPHWTQNVAGLTGQLAGDVVEGRAQKATQDMNDRQQQMLTDWLRKKPATGDRTAWAGEGMRNPVSRALAGEVIRDDILQGPIRAERAEDKKELANIAAQTRADDREARRENLLMQLNARRDDLMLRLAANRENAEAQNELRRQFAANNDEIRRLQIQNTANQKEADRQQKADTAAQKAAQTKGMTATQLKEIAGFEDSIARQDMIGQSFEDSFTGAKAAAYAEMGGNILSSVLPESEKAHAAKVAQFWRDFRANDNVERHALFGSALTQGEKLAWQKTTVSPFSTPAQIRDAIATRRKIANDAMQRRIKLYSTPAPTALPKSNPQAPASSAGRVSSVAGPSGDDRINILLQEAAKATGEDRAAVERELGRLGYSGAIPEAPTPAAPAPTKRLKFNPATGELE